MNWFKRATGWGWTNLGNISLLGGWILSFALPAWAVHAVKLFSIYAPASWVAAGFGGMILAALSWLFASMARRRWVRSAYDARMLAQGGAVDPMHKTFERKRIFLNEFALPSHVIIEGKTFIDCEIVGPANILLEYGNSIDDPKAPICDAVILATGRQFFNGYLFRNCSFRSCSLQRITLFITEAEYPNRVHLNWLNWITYAPPDRPDPVLNFDPQVES